MTRPRTIFLPLLAYFFLFESLDHTTQLAAFSHADNRPSHEVPPLYAQLTEH